MTISKCRRCRCPTFFIYEMIVHESETAEDNKQLYVYRVEKHKIYKIVCKKCKKEYTEEDFSVINF